MTKLAKYRWTMTIVTEAGTEIVKQFDEFEELAALIEHGPSWNVLKHIVITYNRKDPNSAS